MFVYVQSEFKVAKISFVALLFRGKEAVIRKITIFEALKLNVRFVKGSSKRFSIFGGRKKKNQKHNSINNMVGFTAFKSKRIRDKKLSSNFSMMNLIY